MGGYLTFSDKHSRTTGTAIRKEDSFRIAPVAVAITAVAALLIVAVAAVLPYRSDYSVQVSHSGGQDQTGFDAQKMTDEEKKQRLPSYSIRSSLRPSVPGPSSATPVLVLVLVHVAYGAGHDGIAAVSARSGPRRTSQQGQDAKVSCSTVPSYNTLLKLRPWPVFCLVCIWLLQGTQGRFEVRRGQIAGLVVLDRDQAGTANGSGVVK
ncbi:hypothetical protein B0T13DRAFT_446763 [Neurospora crassa]|nr:hypothetical protein B0T13DRAFT_446763 [Neurospora crassa]